MSKKPKKQIDEPRTKMSMNPCGLTDSEFDVIMQLCSGKTNSDVAKLRECSPRTVELHRASAYRRIGASNTIDMVVWAMRNGLMSIPRRKNN